MSPTTDRIGREVYVNILFDWDQDGKWQGSAQCPDGPVPEHVLVNFPVPAGYSGPLSALRPPNFKIGPLGGYVWARFTISERKVVQGWNGDGVFADGETEDYLIKTNEPLKFCDWKDGDGHKMHWAQLPDKQRTGMDVSMYCDQPGGRLPMHPERPDQPRFTSGVPSSTTTCRRSAWTAWRS